VRIDGFHLEEVTLGNTSDHVGDMRENSADSGKRTTVTEPEFADDILVLSERKREKSEKMIQNRKIKEMTNISYECVRKFI
jgi:hypothetical protein